MELDRFPYTRVIHYLPALPDEEHFIYRPMLVIHGIIATQNYPDGIYGKKCEEAYLAE